MKNPYRAIRKGMFVTVVGCFIAAIICVLIVTDLWLFAIKASGCVLLLMLIIDIGERWEGWERRWDEEHRTVGKSAAEGETK